MLKSCPTENAETLLALNKRGQYSVRQAIRHYLKTDMMREGVDKWQPSDPTGVFFDGVQLSWQDCFLLAKLAHDVDMGLKVTAPPYCMGEAHFDFVG